MCCQCCSIPAGVLINCDELLISDGEGSEDDSDESEEGEESEKGEEIEEIEEIEDADGDIKMTEMETKHSRSSRRRSSTLSMVLPPPLPAGFLMGVPNDESKSEDVSMRDVEQPLPDSIKSSNSDIIGDKKRTEMILDDTTFKEMNRGGQMEDDADSYHQAVVDATTIKPTFDAIAVAMPSDRKMKLSSDIRETTKNVAAVTHVMDAMDGFDEWFIAIQRRADDT